MLELLKPGAKAVAAAALSVMPPRARRAFKEYHELRYWKGVKQPIAHDRTKLEHERAHYEYFFTAFFGLGKADYAGKNVLDIGCGPCGSLEWVDVARERVGLDPLADKYRALADDPQAMTYCNAPSEAIPYPDRHFDIVSSFNNLDHVDDVEKTIAEMKRVAARTILLIVEFGHPPTPTEPHSLDPSIVECFAPDFAPDFRRESVRLFGVRPDHNLYASMADGVPYVPGEEGILAARLERIA